ncbi:uncharacterized protein LOC141727396 isoform X2 [Zonotrichia albicollis]|uniref:uncharacterized protein LOC141727396 isoform X2 n=1 Tax=Zonotrichia albicollis TaxID=44394 RepID=UPI003D80D7D0
MGPQNAQISQGEEGGGGRGTRGRAASRRLANPCHGGAGREQPGGASEAAVGAAEAGGGPRGQRGSRRHSSGGGDSAHGGARDRSSGRSAAVRTRPAAEGAAPSWAGPGGAREREARGWRRWRAHAPWQRRRFHTGGAKAAREGQNPHDCDGGGQRHPGNAHGPPQPRRAGLRQTGRDGCSVPATATERGRRRVMTHKPGSRSGAGFSSVRRRGTGAAERGRERERDRGSAGVRHGHRGRSPDRACAERSAGEARSGRGCSHSREGTGRDRARSGCRGCPRDRPCSGPTAAGTQPAPATSTQFQPPSKSQAGDFSRLQLMLYCQFSGFLQLLFLQLL